VPAEGVKPTQLTGAPGHHLQMNWAPDGQSIVFELFNRNRTQQSISRIDRRGDRWSDPVKLAGLPTAAPANPEFSPDGRFVLYIEARGAVRFVASGGGGAVRTLFERTDAPAALATWSADGRGAYVLTGHPRGSAMWHAPISGSPRLVTTFEDPDRQPTRYGFLLHEGRLYFTHGQRQADISVVTLESRE
jgi:Tol biopolymer transport system component